MSGTAIKRVITKPQLKQVIVAVKRTDIIVALASIYPVVLFCSDNLVVADGSIDVVNHDHLLRGMPLPRQSKVAAEFWRLDDYADQYVGIVGGKARSPPSRG